ncbi:hypothetical protein WKY82_10330 [Gordonia malaquae]|uniref:hypothetical protein n=1 Tax=Gordonia malaquae TaxID=410332 RepID=UPI0030C7983F
MPSIYDILGNDPLNGVNIPPEISDREMNESIAKVRTRLAAVEPFHGLAIPVSDIRNEIDAVSFLREVDRDAGEQLDIDQWPL